MGKLKDNYCGLLIIFALVNTTAPFLARTLPSIIAPGFNVIDVRARILPLKRVLSPIVAELPICQNTFPDFAPLISVIFPPAPPIVVNSSAT